MLQLMWQHNHYIYIFYLCLSTCHFLSEKWFPLSPREKVAIELFLNWGNWILWTAQIKLISSQCWQLKSPAVISKPGQKTTLSGLSPFPDGSAMINNLFYKVFSYKRKRKLYKGAGGKSNIYLSWRKFWINQWQATAASISEETYEWFSSFEPQSDSDDDESVVQTKLELYLKVRMVSIYF